MLARAALLSLIVGLSLPACGRPANTPTPTANPAFARLVDDYFVGKFAFRPTSGTGVGLHEHDARFEDWSATRVAARVAELRRQLDTLMALDRAAMGFDDQIDRDALEGAMRAELFDLDELKEWRRNPMMYAGLPGRSLHGLMKREYAPKKDRAASMIKRLEQIPALYAAARNNLENPPRVFTELAIRMAKGSAKFLEGSVKNWAEGAAPDGFSAAHATAVAEAKGYADWLEKELLPKSSGNYALGEQRFLTKLRFEERVELSLGDLLAKGEAQLTKDAAAFVATAKLIDPNKPAADVMKAIEAEHPSEDQLVPMVASSLEDARKFLVDKHIATIPSEVRPRVEETPPFARSGTFASMDTPGPYETGATEAYYYVTPVEKDWTPEHKEEHLRLFNPPVIAMINVHEAWPGHYLQFLWAPKFPTKVRKLIHAGSNSEGWAHYTEQMMVDEGFGGGSPKIRLAQLSEALLRDCRYVVGVKLHTAGMTVEEGAKLFVDKGYQQPANALEEARRGAWNPTYLYYTFGKLEIQALSAEYRRAKGATLQQFHDAFVSAGGLPIPLARRILLR